MGQDLLFLPEPITSHHLCSVLWESADRKGGDIFEQLTLLLWYVLTSLTQRRELSRMTSAFWHLKFLSGSWVVEFWSEILTKHFSTILFYKSVEIGSLWSAHQMWRCPSFTSGGWSRLKVCSYLWNSDDALFLFCLTGGKILGIVWMSWYIKLEEKKDRQALVWRHSEGEKIQGWDILKGKVWGVLVKTVWDTEETFSWPGQKCCSHNFFFSWKGP